MIVGPTIRFEALYQAALELITVMNPAIRQLHVISGLPRSGSTLLSAILSQNPKISASVSSPVVALVETLLPQMSKSSEFVAFFDDDRRKSVLRGAIGGFYEAARSKSVIFDTNRLWTGRLSLLFSLFPDARVVCCVRDIGWIIDSIESVLRQNPLLLSKMFAFQAGSSVYQRAAHLMNAEKGLIGRPWHTLREACFGPHAERLIIVTYDYLVKHPDKVMAGLYDFLDIPMFSHDFENISFDTPDYDDELGMPGLHRVRRKVEARARLPNIPPELFEKHKNASFWQSESVKTRVKVFAFS